MTSLTGRPSDKRALAGRADLVYALARGNRRIQQAMAELLGYERRKRPRTKRDRGSGPTTTPGPGGDVTQVASQFQPVDVPFWRLERYELLQPIEAGETPVSVLPAAAAPGDATPLDRISVGFRPLVASNRLLTTLRRLVAGLEAGHEVDLDLVVDRLGRGIWLDELPRRRRRRWGPRLWIVQDCSERLRPYYRDQLLVYRLLLRLYRPGAVTLARVTDDSLAPTVVAPRPLPGSAHWPPEDAAVLVLGDLGLLGAENDACRDFWSQWGRRLRQWHQPAIALLPGGVGDVPGTLSRCWRLVRWDTLAAVRAGRANLAVRDALVGRLLRWASMAVRMEFGLLRALRLLLPDGAADAALESLVWLHPAVRQRCWEGFDLDPAAADRLLSELDQEPDQRLLRQVRALIEAWHRHLPAEVRDEEALRLGHRWRHLLPDSASFERAVASLRTYVETLPGDWAESQRYAVERAWAERIGERVLQGNWRASPVGEDVRRLWQRATRDRAVEPPAGLRPADLGSGRLPLRQLAILFHAGGLEFHESTVSPLASSTAGAAERVAASPLGTLRLRDPRIRWEESRDDSFWKHWLPPDWVDAVGEDQYGPWVQLRVADATQRLRWIPPGTFLMGSPDDEPGRWDDEGPQHQVTLTRGFWLFDTPCTQALWQAVIGTNPSRFRSPTRPVEKVSWEDCQQFLSKLRTLVPGLNVDLPTEAQWEYACRAGTTEATYAGPIEILGENNAPILDAIAWYSGNSGVDFDLDQGADSSSWPEKQHEFDWAGTRAVALKRPNRWGLFDMLGNVHEWCSGTERRYRGTAITDPELEPESEGGTAARRVFRGGGWDSNARVVRAANRHWHPPGYRHGHLGFRCRVQGELQPAGKPQASDEPPSGKAQPRSVGEFARGRRNEVPAGPWLALAPDRPTTRLLPSGGELTLETDLELLTLRRVAKPPWASSCGRDGFGLWAEFRLPVGNPPVTQRLRYIPPGRFLMGSPDDEPGRWADEGPRHEVIISRGFWLFDTPCVQSMYEAVMGQNPSRFRSPRRPVDTVNWDQCQEFLERLRRLVPDLDMGLPSEAQWEYACRAGSPDATYAGPIEILGERNAPVLDAIGWYGGNSGVDYDLDEGEDASGWTERQFIFPKAGTRDVAGKEPNRWGLYDMLGNVYEWCLDRPREYSDGTEVDPIGPTTARRVFRGGSWYSDARDVRAANRYWSPPDFRYDHLGFRCRVQ
ncbi:MAG: formylglycine-generating enzyme family protein [Pirellulaceae bacterium]|nr:formylglycine-generating enzyme family protein [Pirellulaceae bacterium]